MKRGGKHRIDHGNNLKAFSRDFGMDRPGGGVFAMYIVRGVDVLDGLMNHAPIVLRALPLIAEWIKITANLKVGEGPLCLGCEVEFTRHTPMPVAFLITVPHMKAWETEETSALITGICPACSKRSEDDLIAVARKYWGPKAFELKEGTA